MAFNEDSRVKIPAILHLIRLGFAYIPQSQQHRRADTNIFEDVFVESLLRINPDSSKEEIIRVLDELSLELDYEDLGRKFFQRLTANSGIKLIDFKNFNNNSFHVTAELTCKNNDEEFRPDITVLINGMPLAFIEVKKPHNKEGVIAERSRINSRFKNKHFRRFANITQLMVFSNNMEYEDGIVEPVFGAFYATAAYSDLLFNYFREDEDYPVKQKLGEISDLEENSVLKDNNLLVIKHSPEFKTNKEVGSPTNRILTSLFSRERLAFILRYSIAYVEEEKGLEKHIMRYPQIFATMAIAAKLDEGKQKGIIWHTQGSGKTALAYYNVKHLTDYYQQQNVIPKFYFIVDRIDLLIQASTEFSNRGLKVNPVNSRQEFVRDLQVAGAIHNDSGRPEITVVNIQKFSDDATAVQLHEYDINTQRIYFLDEAHRSYNPKGNYLANLINSDRKAVIIALTGTPLLREVAKEYDSRLLFGNYIHKYYYNRSIADGYTLRLIREEIEGMFKMEMKEMMEQIKLLKGDIKASDVYAQPGFAQGLLDYITKDLVQFRDYWQDETLGGLVVCDSSKQTKMLFQLFEEQYGTQEIEAEKLPMAAEPSLPYGKRKKGKLTAALILHDENDKGIRKELIKAYKAGKIDLLFVYNMLLTGFDAKRLKKLYLARVIQDHNLLQTLTRVNRPYKKYHYGYVVDFADISKAFDRTNQLYFRELQDQLGDEMDMYSNLFKSAEEIKAEIEHIQETLFHFETENREIFSQQISQINDKKELIALVKALRTAKELKNLIALQGYEGLGELVDFEVLNRLLIEAQNRLDNLNFVENIGNEEATQNLLNVALEDIIFQFIKVGEEELKLADELKEQLRKTAHLHNTQNSNDFAKTFDDTLRDISVENAGIFSIKSFSGAKDKLFDELSQFISDSSQRDAFCRALINKLFEFSFEESFEDYFEEKYDFFKDIFEYLIKDYNSDSGGKYAEYYTPNAVARIIANILVDPENIGKGRCYDPSVGSGSLLMSLAHQIGEDKCTIYSEDISQKSSTMLRLNLILNNLTHSIPNVIKTNTISHPFYLDKQKFDYIVSNPPFKLDFADFRDDLEKDSFKERFFAGIPKEPKAKKESMAIYLLFIQHIIFSLNDSGKAAIVVPTGFITAQSGIEKKIRQRLIDKGWLRGVVSMPSNIFASTGTNVSVLIIDKKAGTEQIVLMDASKLGKTVKEGKNQRTVLSREEESQIIEVFNSKEAVEDLSVIVGKSEVQEKNYSFSAGQYFEVKIEYVDITAEEFQEKLSGFEERLVGMFAEGKVLDAEILGNLKKLKIN